MAAHTKGIGAHGQRRPVMAIGQSATEWFTAVTGHSAPLEWQRELAGEENCRDRLIRIPTGLGKTEGILTTWSYHRICRGADNWPTAGVVPADARLSSRRRMRRVDVSRIPGTAAST